MTSNSDNPNRQGGFAKAAFIAKQASISPQVIIEIVKPERKMRYGN